VRSPANARTGQGSLAPARGPRALRVTRGCLRRRPPQRNCISKITWGVEWKGPPDPTSSPFPCLSRRAPFFPDHPLPPLLPPFPPPPSHFFSYLSSRPYSCFFCSPPFLTPVRPPPLVAAILYPGSQQRVTLPLNQACTSLPPNHRQTHPEIPVLSSLFLFPPSRCCFLLSRPSPPFGFPLPMYPLPGASIRRTSRRR